MLRDGKLQNAQIELGLFCVAARLRHGYFLFYGAEVIETNRESRRAKMCSRDLCALHFEVWKSILRGE